MFFSGWNALRMSIHYCPISRILFPQIFFTHLANFLLISIFLTDGTAGNRCIVCHPDDDRITSSKINKKAF